MTILFLASILAGVILSAPIGAAGALVADAALAHHRRRLQLNITAAVAADTLLSVLVALFAQPMGEMLHDHRAAVLTFAGILLILCGAAMGFASWRGHRGVPDAQHLTVGTRWLAAHVAATGTVFLATLLHPGNIAAFLAVGAFFSLHFPAMARCPYLFSAGIGIGGLVAYGAAGYLFWRLRHRADRFVLDFRYAMAVFVAILGVYLLFRRFS